VRCRWRKERMHRRRGRSLPARAPRRSLRSGGCWSSTSGPSPVLLSARAPVPSPLATSFSDPKARSPDREAAEPVRSLPAARDSENRGCLFWGRTQHHHMLRRNKWIQFALNVSNHARGGFRSITGSSGLEDERRQSVWFQPLGQGSDRVPLRRHCWQRTTPDKTGSNSRRGVDFEQLVASQGIVRCTCNLCTVAVLLKRRAQIRACLDLVRRRPAPT
jgi:hypothetical protein